jgi:hypothetical protein
MPLENGRFPGGTPSRRFLKYGLQARIQDLGGREEARRHYEENDVGFQDRIKVVIDGSRGPRRGYSWTGIRDGVHRVARLVDMVESVELLALIERGKVKAPRLDSYVDHVTVKEMPSRKGQTPYSFVMRPMPFKSSDNPAADAFDFSAHCACKDDLFHGEANRRYVSGEYSMCAHIAAAFGYAVDKVSEPVVQNPFAVPREKMIRLKEKVATQTVVVRKEKSGILVNEPPTKAVVEALLWIAMNGTNYRDMFYKDETGTKLVEASKCIKV